MVLMAGMAGAAVNVQVTAPNGGEVIAQKDGNFTVDFNVQTTAAPYNLNAYIYYSLVQGNRENAIVSPVTLGAGVCDDANLEDSTHCSWDWNSTGVNGSYYIDVRVINFSNGQTGDDSSDASFAVDNNSPAIYNYSPSGGWSNSSVISAYLTDFESDVNTATIVFNVEGSNYTTATTPAVAYNSGTDQATLDVSGLGFAPGQTIDINVDVSDLAGNPASQVYWNYTIDNNSPTAGITNNEISSVWVNNDTFSISCTDNESGCNATKWYYFDDDGVCPANDKTNYVNTTTNNFLTVNTDANTYVCLWVEDGAGNHDTDTSLPTKLWVDGTTPQTTHDFAGGWTTDYNVQLTATDFGSQALWDVNYSGIARVAYNINGTDFNANNDTNSQPYSFNLDFNQGWNAFTFYAVDRAGNVEGATSFDVNVDFTPPTNVDINIADNNFWTNDSRPDLDLYAFDGESSVNEMRFSCDNTNWTAWVNYSTTYTDFNMLDASYGCTAGEGNKTVYFQVRDDANNLSASANDSIGFDSILPTTSRNPTTQWNAWQNSDINVTVSCSDPGGSGFLRVDYFIDGAPYSSTNNPATISITTDGNHHVVYYCVDNALNQDNNQSYYAPVDKTAPNTTWDGNNVWQNFDANVHLTCTDGLSGCSQTFYRLDADGSAGTSWGAWATYVNNVLFSSDGNWSIQFYSTDNVGNTESVDENFVLVDKSPPVAPTLNLPAGLNQGFVYITWSGASDAGSGLRTSNTYTVWHRDSNSSVWTALNTGTSTDYNHTGLAKDTGKAECYKIQVFDNLNYDSNSNEDCVWLDSVVPSITSFTSSVSSQTVNLAYSASDTNGSGIKGYYIWDSYSGIWTYTTSTTASYGPLPNGTYTFTLRVTDNADNNSADQNTVATVNYTPPPPSTPGPGGGGSPGGGGGYVPSSSSGDESIGYEGEGEGEESIGEGGESSIGGSTYSCDGVFCSDTDNPCTISRCVGDGECTVLNAVDGTPCNETGACQSGECVMPEEPDLGPTGLIGLGESLALGVGLLAMLVGAYSYYRKRRMKGGGTTPADKPIAESLTDGGQSTGGKWAYDGK